MHVKYAWCFNHQLFPIFLQMEMEFNMSPGATDVASGPLTMCVRAGCTNPAIESTDWDKEYCSNECVATHCRCVGLDLNVCVPLFL